MESGKTQLHSLRYRRVIMPVECAHPACGNLRLPYDSYCSDCRRIYMLQWKRMRTKRGFRARYDRFDKSFRKGKTMEGDFWEKPDEVYGLGNQAVIKTPDGKEIIYTAAPVPDDFHKIGVEPEKVIPRADSPCSRCGTVHVREGNPLCYCIKCGKFNRIVWCGQCVPCTYDRYCEMPSIGVEVANFLFADYVKWKRGQEQDLARVNKMPWEI